MEIINKSVDKLNPYKNNSRTHDDDQIIQIANSIEEVGFTNPILIDEDDGIIAGHGRLMAAKRLELTEVPCIVLPGLTAIQKKAYIIADNKIAMNAGWDYDLLKVEIDSLIDAEFQIDFLGFDTQEMDLIMNGFNEPDIEPKKSGEDMATIKIKCLPLDLDGVFDTIDRAIGESGIEHVVIEAMSK